MEKGLKRAGDVCLKCAKGVSLFPASGRPSSVQDKAKRKGRKQGRLFVSCRGLPLNFGRKLVCEGLDRWIVQHFWKYSYFVSCQELEENAEIALLFIYKG